MSTMTINGRVEPLPDDPENLLIDVVRDALKLTGTKLVCGAGVCGACTVLVDGAPVVSCLMPARAAAGKSVTTVEGIGAGKLHRSRRPSWRTMPCNVGSARPVLSWRQRRFTIAGGRPRERRHRRARISARHFQVILCRCGAYDGIFHAVTEACEGRLTATISSRPASKRVTR
jgi:Aerobic-type carbon monoxide dehydrogenase, small subunit CoxS/CutS homologs